MQIADTDEYHLSKKVNFLPSLTHYLDGSATKSHGLG